MTARKQLTFFVEITSKSSMARNLRNTALKQKLKVIQLWYEIKPSVVVRHRFNTNQGFKSKSLSVQLNLKIQRVGSILKPASRLQGEEYWRSILKSGSKSVSRWLTSPRNLTESAQEAALSPAIILRFMKKDLILHRNSIQLKFQLAMCCSNWTKKITRCLLYK